MTEPIKLLAEFNDGKQDCVSMSKSDLVKLRKAIRTYMCLHGKPNLSVRGVTMNDYYGSKELLETFSRPKIYKRLPQLTIQGERIS